MHPEHTDKLIRRMKAAWLKARAGFRSSGDHQESAPRSRSKLQLEPLEPRLLLSADPISSEIARSIQDAQFMGDASQLAAVVEVLDLTAQAESEVGDGRADTGSQGLVVEWPAGSQQEPQESNQSAPDQAMPQGTDATIPPLQLPGFDGASMEQLGVQIQQSLAQLEQFSSPADIQRLLVESLSVSSQEVSTSSHSTVELASLAPVTADPGALAHDFMNSATGADHGAPETLERGLELSLNQADAGNFDAASNAFDGVDYGALAGLVPVPMMTQEPVRSTRTETQKFETDQQLPAGSDAGRGESQSFGYAPGPQFGSDSSPRAPPMTGDLAVISETQQDQSAAQVNAVVVLRELNVAITELQVRLADTSDNGPRAPPQAENMPRAPPTSDSQSIPANLVIDGSLGAGTGGASITQEQLDAAFLAAKSIWTTAGISADAQARLNNLTVSLNSFDDAAGILGQAVGPQIFIDDNAAGHGWYVDTTPLTTDSTDEAGLVGKVDLLTVLLHEIGHVIGFEHQASDTLNAPDVMQETLTTGVRLDLDLSGVVASETISFGPLEITTTTPEAFQDLLDLKNGLVTSATFDGQIRIDGLVALSGSFTFTTTINLLADINTGGDPALMDDVAMLAYTLVANNVTAFVGINAPDDLAGFDPANPGSALGVYATGVNVGLVRMTPNPDSLSGDNWYALGSDFTALQATVLSAQLVGLDGVTASTDTLTIELNRGSWLIDLPLVADPAIDFDHMGGYTLPGSTITLDYDGEYMLAQANNITLDVLGIASISGSFSFEDGGSETVDVAAGLDAGVDLVGTNYTVDANGVIQDMEVDTVKIGIGSANVFVGIGGPYINSDGSTNDDAMGVSATGLDLGMVLMAPADDNFSVADRLTNPKFFALTAYAGSAGLVGMGDLLTATVTGLDININGGSWPVAVELLNQTAADTLILKTTLDEPVVDFASMNAGAGLEIATGPISAVFIDLPPEALVTASAANVTLSLLGGGVYLSGSLLLEKGGDETVTIETGIPGNFTAAVEGFAETAYNTLTGGTVDLDLSAVNGVPVSTLKIGIGDARIFTGVGYFNADGSVNPDRLGVEATGVDVGIVIAKPDLGIGLLNPKFFALKATAASVDLLGVPGVTAVAQATADGPVEFNINSGSWSFLMKQAFAEAGIVNPPIPTIDFEASFPAESGTDTDGDGKIDPLGLEIETYAGQSIYIDYNADKIIAASAPKVTVEVDGFVQAEGSFSFEMGGTETVTVATGFSITGDVGVLQPVKDLLDTVVATAGELSGVVLAPDYSSISGLEMQTMKIGIGNADAFVGVNGPYYNSDGSTNSKAVGVAASGVDFGLVLMKSTLPLPPEAAPSFYTLLAHANFAGLVGVPSEILTAELHEVDIAVNGGSWNPVLAANQYIPQPAINHVLSFPAEISDTDGDGKIDPVGYEIETGPATSLYADFSTNFLMASTGYAELNVAGAMQLSGSIALVKGATEDVILSDGKTMNVATLTVGIADAYGFMGVGGYWQDTNGTFGIDAGDSTGSGSGIAIADVDAGLALMVSTNLNDPGVFMAMEVDVPDVSLVNVPGVQADASLTVDVNVGTVTNTAKHPALSSGPVVVNLAASFPAETTTDTDGDGKIDPLGLEVPTGGAPVYLGYSDLIVKVEMIGEVESPGLFKLDGTFLLEITASGLAIGVDAGLTIGPGGTGIDLGLRATGALFVVANGSAGDLSITMNATIPGLDFDASGRFIFNTTSALQTLTLPNGTVVSVSAGAPRPGGGTDAAGIYAIIELDGRLTIADFFVMDGDFRIAATESGFQLDISAGLDVMVASTKLFSFTADGYLSITSDGLVASIGLVQTAALPSSMGFSLSGSSTYRLDINTTGGAELLQIHVAGSMNILAITLNGTFDFIFSPEKVEVDINGTISIFGVSLQVHGFAGLYFGANPGIAFSIELGTGNSLRPVDGIDFVIGGNFKLTINTSAEARGGIAARTFEIAVTDVNVYLYGFQLDGALVIKISETGLSIDPAVLHLDFFGIVDLYVGGYLREDGSFSFTITAAFDFGTSGFGLGGSISVTFSNSGFAGHVSGTARAFGYEFASVGADIVISGTTVKATIWLSITIIPAFSFSIHWPWPISKTTTIHVPRVGIDVWQDFVFGNVAASPPPDPVLASYTSGTSGELRLNLGVDATARGGDFTVAGDDTYVVSYRGAGSSGDNITIEGLGFSQDYDNVTSILVNDTAATASFISIDNAVTVPVSINVGGSPTGNANFRTGGGVATVYGGTGSNIVEFGHGGGSYTVASGTSGTIQNVTDNSDINHSVTVYAPGYAGYQLSNTQLVYGDNSMTLTNVGKVDLAGATDANYGVSFDGADAWTGDLTVRGQGSNSTVLATGSGDMTLTNSLLTSTAAPEARVHLVNITDISLSGDSGVNTFTVSGWTGTGQINGNGNNDTLIASNDANFTLSNTQLQRSGHGDLALSSVEIANLTGGNSANTFTVSNWTGTANLDGAANDDIFNINLTGSGSGLTNVTGNSGGNDRLTVNGPNLVSTFIVKTNEVKRANERVTYASSESLTVYGNAARDIFQIEDTSITTNLYGLAANDEFIVTTNHSTLTLDGGDTGDSFLVNSSAATLKINGQDGGDVVNLRATGSGTSTTIDTGAGTGTNVVNISSTAGIDDTGNVNNIAGVVQINGTGDDTVNIYDKDSGAQSVELTATQVTGLGLGQRITFNTSGKVERVNLFLGNRADTINVKSTDAATVTTVKTGSGSSNTINVGSTAPNTSGNVNSIAGHLIINAQSNADTLNLYDKQSANQSGSMTSTTITGLGMGANGITYNSGSDRVESLNIYFDAANDTFSVLGTDAATTTFIDAANGNDTINVQAIAAGLTTINTGAGTNTINAGSTAPANSGNVNGINGHLVINAEGTDTLNVYDKDSGTQTGNLTSTEITGLNLGDRITYNNGGNRVETLNIYLGDRADTFNVFSTDAATTTLIDAAGGTDTINVQTIAAGLTTVNTGSGNNTVNVGSTAPAADGDVNGIVGHLVVNGESSTDTLNVYDKDAGDETGNLTATDITGLDLGDRITYNNGDNRVETLNIYLGARADIFNVLSTDSSTVTTLNVGSAEANIINVGSNAPGVNGNVDSVDGYLIVNGGSAADTLNVDDTSDSNGDIGWLSVDRLTGLDMGSGADDSSKGIEYHDIDELNINLGSGNENFTVLSTHTTVTNIQGRAGTDTLNIRTIDGQTNIYGDGSGSGNFDDLINVGSNAGVDDRNFEGTLDGINALLTVYGNGQTDVDRLTVDDSGDTDSETGQLTATDITGLGMGGSIVYSGIEALHLMLGAGDDSFHVASTHTDSTRISGGPGADSITVATISGATQIEGDDPVVPVTETFDVINRNYVTLDRILDNQAAITLTIDGVAMVQGTDFSFDNGSKRVQFNAHLYGEVVVSYTGNPAAFARAGPVAVDTSYQDTISVNVTPEGIQIPDNGIGALLSIDGQHESDQAIIYLAGKAHSDSYPVSTIDVHDSGYAADGADTLTIFGTNDELLGDNFLFRRDFVALIPVVTAGETDTAERVNYDYTINGGLIVYGQAGDDNFVLDDNSVITTIDGGRGDDRFQVGQMFQSTREYPKIPVLDDQFYTIETTKGFLSNGNGQDTTILGGQGDDTYVVLHNTANLNLDGGSGNDSFSVRAFALKGSQAVDPNQQVTDITGGLGADFVEYTDNAPVNIDGGAGVDTVVVIGTEFSDTFAITKQGVYGAGLYVQMVNVEILEIDGMEGNDHFIVYETSQFVSTTIFGGLGSDTFDVGGTTGGQAVTVTSNDLLGHSGLILHDVESTDPTYNDVSVEGISANVADNDEAAVVITPLDVGRLIEGAFVPFTAAEADDAGIVFTAHSVVLTRKPEAGDVYITVATAQKSLEQAEAGARGLDIYDPATGQLTSSVVLVFTADNWATPQVVYAVAQQDDYAEGGEKQVDQVFAYDGGAVTLEIAPASIEKITVDGQKLRSTEYSLDGNTVTLTPANQPAEGAEVVVTYLLADGAITFEVISHSISGDSSAEYVKVKVPQRLVQVIDDDAPGIAVTPIDPATGRPDFETIAFEGGASDAYVVSITTAPLAGETVTVSFETPDDLVLKVDGEVVTEVTFTAADTESKLVTIEATDEANVEGLGYAVISHTVTSSLGAGGAGYNNLTVTDIDVRTVDNDSSHVLIRQTNNGTSVIESASGSQLAPVVDTYTVVLTQKPTADVRVNVAPGVTDTGGTLFESFVYSDFTNDQVTLNVEPRLLVSIDIDGRKLSKTEYSLDGSVVTLNVNTAFPVRDNARIEVSYRFADAAKQVTVSSGSTTSTTGSITLVFTPDNWDQPQTVTVSAIDDSWVDGGNKKVFAPQPEKVNGLRGPLRIEGGIDPDGDRELPPPVLLPGETDPFEFVADDNMNLRVNESEQIDILNVYNNASVSDDVGTLTDTQISGLGMSPDRVIAGRDFAGGITYVNLEMISINLGSGDDKFLVESTHAGETTIMANGGNDELTIRTLGGVTNARLGSGNDTVNVGSQLQVLDQISGLLTVRGGNGSDTMNLIDSGDSNANILDLTGSTIDGMDLLDARVQTLSVTHATGGHFGLQIGSSAFVQVPFQVSSEELKAIVLQLDLPGVNDVLVDRSGNVFTLAFLGDESLETTDLSISVTTGDLIGDTSDLPPAIAISQTTTNLAQVITLNGQSDQTVTLGDTSASFTVSAGTPDSVVRDAIIDAIRSTGLITSAEGIAVGVKDVIVERFGNSYIVLFQGLLRGDIGHQFDFSVAATSAVTPGFNDSARVHVNAVAGTFTLDTGKGRTWEMPWDVTAEQMAAALNAVLGVTTVSVDRDSSGDYLVSNLPTGEAALLSLDDRSLDNPIEVTDRTQGISYRNIETLNIQLAEHSDVINVQGTTAVTNIFANGGDDRIYVSSLADEDLTTALTTDFLEGDLDDLLGELNIDAGNGRHLLMISDETALVADTDVIITDQPTTGLPGAEIQVSGLAPAVITYQAAATGNYADGITLWSGYGNDVFTVDGSHERAGLRTNTTLNTGLGDDDVTLDLDSGEDGFFVLNTQGPYNAYLTLSDRDTVYAAESSLPLIIFAGQDSDVVTGGTSDDIVFGDRGQVEYVDASGQLVAVLGNGGPNDSTDGVNRTAARIYTLDPLVGGDDTITSLSGNDILLGGINRDTITAESGNNIVIGDSGLIDYFVDDADLTDIDRIWSTDVDHGGNDTITTGEGDDIIIAGEDGELVVPVNVNGTDTNARTTVADATNGDTIVAGNGDNLVIGDNGRITSAEQDLVNFGTQPITLGRVETIESLIGGADSITTGVGRDIVLGGIDQDVLTVNDSENISADRLDANNIVIGDSGFIDWTVADSNAADIDQIWSTEPDDGANDTITTGERDDIIIGGEGNDTIVAGNGDNLVIGDNGQITSAEQDLVNFGTQPITLGRVTSIAPTIGGNDSITTGINQDIIFGGVLNDTIIANASEQYDRADASQTRDQNNIIIADNGFIDWVADDSDAADIDRIASTDPTAGGADQITSGAGNDFIIGGTASDTIYAGAGNDLVFGDHGRIDTVMGGGVIADNLPLSTLNDSFTFTAIDTRTADLGAADDIFGQDGDDIILGQQGDDRLYGGNDDDDIIGGHNVAGGQDGNDRIDGGSDHEANDSLAGETDNDVIAGDNASILRRGDTISPRLQELSGDLIYDSNDLVQVTGAAQANPTGVEERDIILLDHSHTPTAGTWGNDYIAGGPGDDVIFGQLGNDTLLGDGEVLFEADVNDVSAAREAGGTLTVNPSFELATDGDDYIEGNGGNDLIFGNLGQDDIIGGNSDLFGLSDPALRPDGADLLFGGAGTDINRNDLGQAALLNGQIVNDPNAHARDADVLVGDNGNIFRLVTGGEFQQFNYDQNPQQAGDFEQRGDLRLVVRAVELLDYTLGGADYDAAAAATDLGAADEIHGESGDDAIYGMVGADKLFGEGQDDDLIGGYGNDWISGGTGTDGVIGDDGRIYTSRNSTAYGESLYGIDPVSATDLRIDTPGNMQVSIINVAFELNKSVNLTPFNVDPAATQDPLFDPADADDIIYGGLGDDFLHGGAGDDAMSGAEALPEYYALAVNNGDVLGYGKTRDGEFNAYNESAPMSKVWVDANGLFTDPSNPDAREFVLNFTVNDTNAPDDTRSPGTSFAAYATDGDDRIFGDLGNDWLVGGTGNDRLYGGRGDDLMNVDDDQDTAGGANDVPDTHPSYEDTAFGGAGRDILIANTGGDRLIDWNGEFNSYLVPFSPFGAATISRSLAPALMEYLYELSAADGADRTRAADAGTDAARNGEPDGEIGLVNQKDADWGDQQGAPDDPQPGNSGGSKDVRIGADTTPVDQTTTTTAAPATEPAPATEDPAPTADSEPVTYTLSDVAAIQNKSTLISTLVITDNLVFTSMDIQLNITHKSPADLQVSLIAPDGSRYALDVTGGSIQAADLPADLSGTWSLEIVNNAKGQKGTLDSWTITLNP